MKKILALLIVSIFALPAFAACSIDSHQPCTASIFNETNTSIQDRTAPNPLNQMQKTDAFQPKYRKPYYDALINTNTGTPTGGASADYNSNCQFGVCLPGGSNMSSEDTFE